jgi:hypothetical protein
VHEHFHAAAGARPDPLQLHVSGARALRVRLERIAARANRGVAIAGNDAVPGQMPELLTGPVTAPVWSRWHDGDTVRLRPILDAAAPCVFTVGALAWR